MLTALRSLALTPLLAAALASPSAGQCLAETLGTEPNGYGFTVSANDGLMVASQYVLDGPTTVWSLGAGGHVAGSVPSPGNSAFMEDVEIRNTSLGVARTLVGTLTTSRLAFLFLETDLGLEISLAIASPLLAPAQIISITENSAGVWFAVASPDDGDDGHVSLYLSTATNPTPTFVTTIDPAVGGSPGARFGVSVSMADDVMVISCPNSDIQVQNGGHFEVYEFDGSAWVFTGFFVGVETNNYAFGRVYTDGTTVMAATVLSDDGAVNAGKVDFFRFGLSGLAYETTSTSAVTEERYGFTADIDGDHAIIGTANGERVRMFERVGGGWVQTGETTAPDPGLGFGTAVAVDASPNPGATEPRFYVGHTGYDEGEGAVHVYSVATSGVTSLPTELAGFLGMAPTLAATSDVCAFAGDLELLASDMRPTTAATLVIGFSTLSAPFKGGTLGPSPDLIVPGLPTGFGGLPLSLPLPYGAAGLDLALQLWVQDVDGPVGFSATNTLVVSLGG